MNNSVFTKIPHLKLTEHERYELYQIQGSLKYEEFYNMKQGELTKDGNYIARDPNLPNWVNEKFRDILKHSKRILFLKNKGTITHKDLRRRCSLTVPLKSSTPTIFYKSNSGNTDINPLSKSKIALGVNTSSGPPDSNPSFFLPSNPPG